MDFSGRIILSFIEEDNTQRSYFRIRPLLTAEGIVPKSDIDSLPDEGYLRIVPDKNEQQTFKERMRSLGNLCVLDLLSIPPDVIKIRSNKNYAPQRGESNQYIVYSDTVQAIPTNLFYEVVTAEPGDKEKIAKAVTPLCYLRSGGRIHGPVSRATGLDQEGASLLLPDSDGICAVPLPDGSERLFYWPPMAAKAAQTPFQQREDPARDAMQTAKLNGIPFYQTAVRRMNEPKRAYNSLIDTVDQQLRSSKLEAPGAQLTSGIPTQHVENPMDAFKRALGVLWMIPEMQRQAVAHFLSMTGVQNILNQQLAGKETDAVVAAINRQIEDLEAERLALLMQLENGRRNKEQLKQEALSQLTHDENEMVARLRREAAEAQRDLEEINTTRAALITERNALLEELAQAAPQVLRIAAPLGGHAQQTILCDRVQQNMQAAGFVCSKDDAVHYLTLLCQCGGQMEFASAVPADAKAAAQAFAMALGAGFVYNGVGGREVRTVPGGDAFRMIIAPQAAAEPDSGCVHLIVRGQKAQREEGLYAQAPWPVAHVTAQSGWRVGEPKAYPPVQAASVCEVLFREKTEPPMAALQVIDAVDAVLTKFSAPRPQCTRKAIYDYLSAAPVHMEGSIAKALDYAVSAWILPHARACGVPLVQLKPSICGLNKSLALLEG